MSTVPVEQKALAVPQRKGEYTLVTTPVPRPRPGEVLVELKGAALNHLEWKLPYAPYEIVPYPLHSGTDGAGIVASVGEGVVGLKKGDRILFQGWFDAERSSFQEYAVVHEQLCAKLPENLDFLQAASIPLALITAAFGLCLPNQAKPSPTLAANDFKSPPRGGAGIKPFWESGSAGSYSKDSIIILGGTSSVGQFAIQIAKYLGFTPIITTASPKHTEYLKSLGATVVIDRHDNFNGASSALYDSAIKATVVFDAAGVDITQEHVDVLATGGKLVSVAAIPLSLDLSDGKQGIVTFGAAHYYSEFAKGMFAKLEDLLENGTLKPLHAEKLSGGLSSIPQGLERLRDGKVNGVKLVVDPSETKSNEA